MEVLTSSIKSALKEAQTDSEIIEIAEANGVDAVACFDYLSRQSAKGKCATCRHTGLYPSMFPCNACVEAGLSITSRYEAVTNE